MGNLLTHKVRGLASHLTDGLQNLQLLDEPRGLVNPSLRVDVVSNDT
jgi:hypothetical protein